MLVPDNRRKPLDASKLSAAAKAVPDFNVADAADAKLPKDYVRITKALLSREPADWAKYKTFAKIFKRADPTGVTAGNKRDAEMSGDSPGKKEGASAQGGEEDPLTFDLSDKYESAFDKFKK